MNTLMMTTQNPPIRKIIFYDIQPGLIKQLCRSSYTGSSASSTDSEEEEDETLRAIRVRFSFRFCRFLVLHWFYAAFFFISDAPFVLLCSLSLPYYAPIFLSKFLALLCAPFGSNVFPLFFPRFFALHMRYLLGSILFKLTPFPCAPLNSRFDSLNFIKFPFFYTPFFYLNALLLTYTPFHIYPFHLRSFYLSSILLSVIFTYAPFHSCSLRSSCRP